MRRFRPWQTTAPDLGGPEWIARYLERLRLDHPGKPSVAGLRALHRAHVERVPYEALDIQLGRPTTVEPAPTVEQVLRGRGGYCVQLNTAFAELLTGLGFELTRYRAGVQVSARAPAVRADFAPHLTLTVALEGELWLADVGLGDALHDPLPLRGGRFRQGPHHYRLGPSEVEPGGWRFDHDPRCSIAGMDIAMVPAAHREFAEWHPYVATSPESRVVKVVTMMRRDATGSDSLTGCMLRRVEGEGRTEREITDQDDWYGVLHEVFGLELADLGMAERAALWTKVWNTHRSWLTARAAKTAAQKA